MGKSRAVSGATLIYDYLQKELQNEDLFLFQMVTARLITSLGVWFHPQVYAELPIPLPHVIRDAKARKAVGGVEMWGSPDASGRVRDDNSLVKALGKGHVIDSPRPMLNGRHLGAGWVASHVWRIRVDGSPASAHGDTNSFIPNLVWLPKTVSYLSDREGSFVQAYLQAISRMLYRDVVIEGPSRRIAELAWEALPAPPIDPASLPSRAALNFFRPKSTWAPARRKKIAAVHSALTAAAEGRHEDYADLKPSRFRDGLVGLHGSETLQVRGLLEALL